MKVGKDKRRTTNILAALCFTMALVSLLSSIGSSMAKFVQEKESAGIAVAAPFYFTSKDLDGRRHPVDEPPADGTVEIDIALANFVDDLRCTVPTISYTCRVIKGTDLSNTSAQVASQSGTLTGGEESSAVVPFELERSDFDGSGTVTIVAEATAPYQKTLTAEFYYVAGSSAPRLTVYEENGAVVAEVSGGSGGQVTVQWPSSGVLPDPSNELLQAASGSSVTFTAEAGRRYALTFVKTGTYQNSDFTLS